MIHNDCDLPTFPPELIRAVTRDAERDADDLGQFLAAIGLAPSSPDQPFFLPRGTLLKLGAAMHLLRWETAGHSVHRQAGLPAANEVIRQTLLELSDDAAESRGPDASLSVAVMRLAIDRFAWSGQPMLQADVAIDFPDEDSFLDGLVTFLWAHRHDVSPLDLNPHDESSS